MPCTLIAATQGPPLDELIRSSHGAHNALLDLEELSQQDLDSFLKCYQKLAHEARKNVQEGLKDTDTPEVKKRAP